MIFSRCTHSAAWTSRRRARSCSPWHACVARRMWRTWLSRSRGASRPCGCSPAVTRVSLVVLYQVLAQSQDGSVISELEYILDLHTPYYKAIFEALPTQAQQLVGAMCLHWHPLSAATLAALPTVRLDTNVVSAQLDRLSRDGMVEKALTPGGEKLLYQVAERFFNIWYLMRASRHLRRKLVWLAEFLAMVYAPPELHTRAQRFLRADPMARRAEMAFVYAQTVHAPALRQALAYEALRSMLREPREQRQPLAALLDFEAEDGALKSHAERLTTLYELEQRVLHAPLDWSRCRAEEFWHRLGGAWVLSLEEKQHIVERLETMTAADIQAVLQDIERWQEETMALLGLEHTQILMEALRSGDMATLTDVDGADAAAERLNAPALHTIARLERARRQWPPLSIKEIDALREISTLDTDDVYVTCRFSPLLAAHAHLRAEAAQSYRQALAHSPQHPYLWDGLGTLLLDRLQRYEEAETAYRQAIALAPHDATLWNKFGGLLIDHQQRYREAEAAYRQAIALDASFAAPWFNLGLLFQYELQRYGEAEAAYRQAIQRAPMHFRYLCQLAWLLFLIYKDIAEAEAKARQALEIVPNNLYITHTLACILARQTRWPEAATLARCFIVEGYDAYYTEFWPDIVLFFKEAVRTGHAADAAALLASIGYEDRWRPLREALRAIAAGSDASLLHMAPELRQPAEALLAQLLPEGVTLSNAGTPRRARQARRKAAG